MRPGFRTFQYSSRAKIPIHHGDRTDRKGRIDRKQAYCIKYNILRSDDKFEKLVLYFGKFTFNSQKCILTFSGNQLATKSENATDGHPCMSFLVRQDVTGTAPKWSLILFTISTLIAGSLSTGGQ